MTPRYQQTDVAKEWPIKLLSICFGLLTTCVGIIVLDMKSDIDKLKKADEIHMQISMERYSELKQLTSIHGYQIEEFRRALERSLDSNLQIHRQ